MILYFSEYGTIYNMSYFLQLCSVSTLNNPGHISHYTNFFIQSNLSFDSLPIISIKTNNQVSHDLNFDNISNIGGDFQMIRIKDKKYAII